MASSSRVNELASRSNGEGGANLNVNHSNFHMSGLPEQMMFYFLGEWNHFPGPINSALIKAFREGKSSFECKMVGWSFIIDFQDMVMKDLETKLHKFIAWVDESGKCYYPAVFSNGEQAPNGHKENGSYIFSFHRSCGFESTNERLILLERGGSSYESVYNKFLSGMRSFVNLSNVVAIHQYVPKDHMEIAYSSLFQKHAEITSRCPGNQNFRWAWIGASKEGIIEILLGRFLGRENISGSGIKFSPENCAYMSASDCEVDENGMQHMLLCRVVLSNGERNRPGPSCTSCSNANSGDDDLDNPLLYYIWSTLVSHIHPESIISFRLSRRVREKIAMLKDQVESSTIRQ